MKYFWQTLLLLFLCAVNFAQEKPLKLGIAGLTHGHVGWILGREHQPDINMVGIAEPNRELAQRLSKQYGFSMGIVFDSLEEMITATQPEAVAAFGDIKNHLSVVQTCAPKGIHVMVEKPLAVSLQDAKEMELLALKHQVHVLTNYETSWYETYIKAKGLLEENRIGDLRKVIIRDGHKGPKKIGVSKEFLDWLTDPALNGGGAIMDFGCYGANVMTWLMKGKKPISVTAVTQQLQPENNPNADDDATIVLKYERTMAILEPSWNWPIGRKDMELYGETGALYADDANRLRIRESTGYSTFKEETFFYKDRPYPYNDPFSVFAAVINNTLKLEPFDPYTLENNVITMEILQASLDSATLGRTVMLKD